MELLEKDLRESRHQSSKGNQLKWCKDRVWYKADYTGYEGLAEYMVSNLLEYSSLCSKEYVLYETEKIVHAGHTFSGCASGDFREGQCWQVLTLERLFRLKYQESLYRSIFKIREPEERLKFLVDQVVRVTGLEKFGTYMGKLLTVDALFLNEDRHTHNIAVLWDGYRAYEYCPLFDHGAALLADTTVDYPLGEDPVALVRKVEAMTFSRSFEEQLEVAEKLYGETIRFHFGEKEIRSLLEADDVYDEKIKHRVYTILLQQRRKYQYLFQKK